MQSALRLQRVSSKISPLEIRPMLRFIVMLLAASMSFLVTAKESKALQLPLPYYDLSEIVLIRTKPAKKGASAVFRDPTGRLHHVKIGSTVATNQIELHSVHSESVKLGKLVQCPDEKNALLWCLVALYELKISAPPVQLPVPPWFKDEASEWPTTLESAVQMTIYRLSEKDKEILKNTKEEDLFRFHHGWGTGIRNHYGLWGGNNKLILSACRRPCHPDHASASIIKTVWKELQK